MIVDRIVKAVSSVLPARRPIGHHEPCYDGVEVTLVNDCLAGNAIGYDHVRRLERGLSEAIGAEQVLAVSSGTAALHLALLALGIGPGDEVLLPSMTFVATANAVAYTGAVPHFVDGPQHLRPYKLERYLDQMTGATVDKVGRVNPGTGRRIKAVIAVDLLGTAADLAGLEQVASNFGLVLIEDAAEALGARVGNMPCGNWGLCGILSFNNNKIVTTGGGGALLTNDPWIAARSQQLATQGKVRHPWRMEHDALGFNYAMPNLCAAFGLGQLGRLPELVEAKRALNDRYRSALSGIEEVSVLPMDVDDRRGNGWLTAVRVPVSERDVILEELHKVGILARALFTPLHKLPFYAGAPRSSARMLESEALANSVICLPSGAGL